WQAAPTSSFFTTATVSRSVSCSRSRGSRSRDLRSAYRAGSKQSEGRRLRAMPRFLTSTTDHEPIADGTYVLKVLSAVERISERGTEMLVMKLGLSDGRRSIPCTITFVPAAKALVNAFVESCELTKPPGNDVETELPAEHVRGRYLYAVVVNDVSDP